MYQQLNGVSMVGSLGPVLANIVMTECEKVIVDKLIEDKTTKFYVRYVDNTLLVIKRTDILYVLNKFNNFNDNLEFTTDTFENYVPHFFDIEICPNGLGIYHKHTQTGQYVNFDLFICVNLDLFKWKVSWICSLVTRTKRICLENYLNEEIQLIKNYAAWDCYLEHIVNSIVKQALRDRESNNIIEENTTDPAKIFMDLKFLGSTTGRIVKNCIKKLCKCFKKEVTVNFVLHYQTTKLCYFTNTKTKHHS